MREEKRKIWKDPALWLSLLLVLLVMAVIFYFSAQPAPKSSGSSDGFVTRLIAFFWPDFQSLPAGKRAEISFWVSFAVRKTAHILEYAALGFSLVLHLRVWAKYAAVRRLWLTAFGIGTAYAALDEIHQFFVEGRGPKVYDVGFDCLGLLAGMLFLFLCLRLAARRRERSTRKTA